MIDSANTESTRPAQNRLSVLTSPRWVLSLVVIISFLIYLFAIVIPYNIFDHVAETPVSMPEIAQRERPRAAVFLLAFLTLFALYALAYRICRRRPERRLVPFILVQGLAFALVLSMTYPVGAGDVVDYISYGEVLAFFDTNPLVTPPAEVPGAAFAPFSAYRYTTSNYGPVWTWISAAVVRLLGQDSLTVNLFGFKAVAIVSYLVQSLLIYSILKRRDPDSAPAGLLMFAWNPLILYEFAANAHNDATMMMFAMLGIFFWDRKRPLLMSGALTLSFLVKIPTAPILALLLLSAARRQQDQRRFWLTLLGGGVTILAITGLAYLSLPNTVESLSHLSRRSDLYTHSLPTIVKQGLQLLGAEEDRAKLITRSLSLLALGTWYLIQLWKTWRTPADALRHTYSVILFILLFVTPWFQPWYVTWLVALAALYPIPAAPGQAGLFSYTVTISYVIFGFVWFWVPHIGNWGGALGINLLGVITSFTAPWLHAAYLGWKSRRARSHPGDYAVTPD